MSASQEAESKVEKEEEDSEEIISPPEPEDSPELEQDKEDITALVKERKKTAKKTKLKKSERHKVVKSPKKLNDFLESSGLRPRTPPKKKQKTMRQVLKQNKEPLLVAGLCGLGGLAYYGYSMRKIPEKITDKEAPVPHEVPNPKYPPILKNRNLWMEID